MEHILNSWDSYSIPDTIYLQYKELERIAIGSGQVEDEVVETAEQKPIIWQGAEHVSIFGIGHLVAAGRGEKWVAAEIQSLENTPDKLCQIPFIQILRTVLCNVVLASFGLKID